MFKFTKKFQREKEQEKKRREEISKIVQEIPVIEKKIDEEKKNLSLPLAIKKFSEKKALTPLEGEMLNAMLAMYKETKIELSSYKSASESKLGENVNHSDIGPSVLIQAQNSVKTTALLKQEQTPTKSGVEVIDELKLKLAKQRELLDKQNTNTEQTQKNNKKSEDQKTELTEKSEEGKFSNPTTVEGQFMPVSKIVEEISRPNSILDDEFYNSLKTINDFIKENDPQQQPQTPLSMQFKPYNKHEPVIVEMTPKPNFK
ncbi:MAG TPA: hypothetical protein VGH95_04650 [Candidatus Aquirickettsiella sp.]|jgi:hypothetical protein